MTQQIRVFGRANSSNVQIVMWVAAELGLNIERLDYGFTYGGTDTADYRAMNPFGLVPVLKDGDDPAIFESMAILRYLASKYGDGGPFWPADPALRAQVDKWAEWGKSSFAAGFGGPIFWPVIRTAAKDRDDTALKKGIANFHGLLNHLETQLDGQDHVCGADFTAADIAIGHILYRYFEVPITRKPLPNVEAYYARLCARSAYRDHVMVSFDDLRVEGA